MTYRIGSVEHARAVWNKNNDWTGRIPGFTKLGSGAYRAAYLHRDTGIVYKVGDTWANTHEVTHSRRLRSMLKSAPVPVWIPRVRDFKSIGEFDEWGETYNNIIAAELFDGKPAKCRAFEWATRNYWNDTIVYKSCNCKRNPCHKEALSMLADWSGLSDMHYANVLWNGTRYGIVDMGEGEF